MNTSNQGMRPQLTFWQIWNMCFGFLGLQFGFALQNANVSRIFQSLGADVEQIPALWIAAPLTGLIVQPIVGYFSDRTWTRLGRRRPYFLVGAIFASAALVAMPRSPSLWIAAGLLWILDASINISMEPFRAFVGDQLPPAQRPGGYAMQSFFIGVGAIVASFLPWLLAKFGVSNHVDVATGASAIPDTVRYAFDLGAVVLFLAIGWTILRSREYPPEQLHAFADTQPAAEYSPPTRMAGYRGVGLLCLIVGVAGFAGVTLRGLDKNLYVLCGMITAFGIALLIYTVVRSRNMFTTIMSDLLGMPATMRDLIPVQFFSWLALFAMWIYTVAAVTEVHYGTKDALSDTYNDGANWVGVLFGAYNGYAALAAIVIPVMARRLGMRFSHLINLALGGIGLISFNFVRDPTWLLVSMIGVGFAWASILSLPYALLSDSVPAKKMGVYMGIFNFFIVIPQLVAVSILGTLIKVFFGGAPIHALMVGGASFFIAGVFALRVQEPRSTRVGDAVAA
jgi:maltose/moltooligosaccharide transporter